MDGGRGAIAATIITNLVICHVVEPYVLYKYAFERSVKGYFLKNYGMILILITVLVVFKKIMWVNETRIMQMAINGILSIVVSGIVCIILLLLQPNTRRNLCELLKKE